MKRVTRILTMSVFAAIFMAVMVSLSFAQPQLPIKPKIPTGPRITVPDNPVIREFSATPTRVVKGKNSVFRWTVEPGPGGSPITSVSISKIEGSGPPANLSSSDLRGELTVRVPSNVPEGRTVYAITVVNQIGRSTVKSISLEILDAPDLTIMDDSLRAEYPHAMVRRDGLKCYSLRFLIENKGGEFLGELTLTATVNGATAPIAITLWEGTEASSVDWQNATVPLTIRDFRLSRHKSRKFWLRGPDSNHWKGSSYILHVRLSTNDPDEISTNNEKRRGVYMEP